MQLKACDKWGENQIAVKKEKQFYVVVQFEYVSIVCRRYKVLGQNREHEGWWFQSATNGQEQSQKGQPLQCYNIGLYFFL